MTWQRLESATVDPSLTEGLEARTADPLWFLARQWQTGEFRGEDAADPLLVRLVARSSRIDQVRLGDGPALDAPSVGLPLEALVEAEPVRRGPARARVAAELGQVLLGALQRTDLGRQLADRLRTNFELTVPDDDGLDPTGRRRLELLARRSVDGVALADALAGDPGLAQRLVDEAGIAGRPAAALAGLLSAWGERSAKVFVEPERGEAWDPRRLEYRFEVGTAGTPSRLRAHEYAGGDLHWFHFDLDAADAARASEVDEDERDVTVLPVPLRYAGMPASRFWEFEESDVFFAGIQAAPGDLARVAVATYATCYGTDWYIVPLRLPLGSLTRIIEVQVIDDFGARTTVGPAAALDGPHRAFRFFELSGDPGPEAGHAPLLPVLPIVETTQAARPLEDVRVIRDELASRAWAVERRIESLTGRPIDLAARSAPRPVDERDDAAAVGDNRWELVLSTSVPDNWVPLVPVRLGDEGAMVLQRGRMPDRAGRRATRGAQGAILEPNRRFLLHEEEIPREGLRVVRQFQEARAASGHRYTWIGRRKGPGRGEGASGLVFDRLNRRGHP